MILIFSETSMWNSWNWYANLEIWWQ